MSPFGFNAENRFGSNPAAARCSIGPFFSPKLYHDADADDADADDADADDDPIGDGDGGDGGNCSLLNFITMITMVMVMMMELPIFSADMTFFPE